MPLFCVAAFTYSSFLAAVAPFTKSITRCCCLVDTPVVPLVCCRSVFSVWPREFAPSCRVWGGIPRARVFGLVGVGVGWGCWGGGGG